MTEAETTESVEAFRARARQWLADNMPRAADGFGGFNPNSGSDEEELENLARCRAQQRMLFDAGLAGICVPRAYGGQGLTDAHQVALNEEIRGYEYPSQTQIPTFSPCMAVLLEFGTEAQKQRFIPPILKGETFWMQMLSEPSGGSDVASALTTAVRDGEEWVLNGSKIWTTGAWWADWGLCLARTNWDVPKHRGLTVFVLELHQPDVEIHRIEMLNGSREFCQEFLTDVRIPDDQRIGDVDDGWTVGTRWMYHERTVAGGSPYVTAPSGRPQVSLDPTATPAGLLATARRRGRADDQRVRELVGESYALSLIGQALTGHIRDQIRTRAASEPSAAITRLWFGAMGVRSSTITYELNGAQAVAWGDEDADTGRTATRFLMRQSSCIAGGTTEMARNVISERVLGMPRERTLDKDVPFRDIPRSAPSR